MRIRGVAVMAVLLAGASSPAISAVPTPGVVPSYCVRTPAGYRCTIGPFDVQPGERLEMMTGVAAPSAAGYITSARARLVNSSGRPVGHHLVHLHHAVWLNPHERDMTCDSYDDGRFPAYERFFATGKELTKLEMPRGYGYRWDPGIAQPYTQSAPWWWLVVHLDGMHGSSDVSIELDLGFVPDAEAKDMVSIKPVWLDVRNCNSEPVYDVRRGSGKGGVDKERWTFKMPTAGRFVFLAGHLHDGGLRTRLENRTTGRHLYTSRALYGIEDEPWYLTAMTTWSSRRGLAVGRGDVLRLTAAYDSSRSWRDVMGIMVGGLAPR
jgi:hypothetical protein